MEKLEKHIKNTLEERRISPSSGTWDKISSQVTVVEKPNRTKWLVYAVAASFIGILLVSVFFFKSENISDNTIQVAEQNEQKEELIQQKEQDFNPKEIEENRLEVTKVDTQKQPKENRTGNQTTPLDQQKEITEISYKQPLRDEVLKDPNILIAQKVNEVVAQVELLEIINDEVSNAEVDSLLRAAQRQILTERIFKSDKVDALALLTEVEDELDESFRDQIFDALKDGYFKLRTAVADRNN